MRRLLPPILLTLVVACSKGGDSAGPSATSSASPASAASVGHPSGAAPAVAAAAPSGSGSDLHCDKLIPADLRAKYFQGMELKESGQTPHDCLFAAPGIEGASKQVSVGYRCGQTLSDAAVASGLAGLRTMDKGAKDIPGLGRAALDVTFLGNHQIHVYDDKTPCVVTLGFGKPYPANAQEIARAVLGALTPAAIGK